MSWKNRLLRLLGFAQIGVALVVGAAGCVEIDCTTEARASVTVTVVDETGQPLPGATVSYSVDSPALQPCIESGASGTWMCGFEQAGVFTIYAEREGYVSASDSVTVTEDQCHVETQVLEITIEPEPPTVTASHD